MYARDTALFATPIGRIALSGDDAFLHAIRIGAADGPMTPGSASPVRQAGEQLQAWFAGERLDFDLPLAPALTPRGAALRAALVAVRYGSTMRYGALATLIASGPRAIGQACARNPFPIVVPCHRIVAATGLGAYSAGEGMATKQWLLDHERRHRERLLP